MPNIVETEAKMRKRGKWLTRAGWGLFAASLLMPSFRVGFGEQPWMSGWDCFVTVLQGLFNPGEQGIGSDWYLRGFGLMNLAMLASPLAIKLKRRDMRWLRRIGLAMAGVTAYVLSFPFYGEAWRQLGVGYYAWLISFGLVTLGALHQAVKRPNRVLNRASSPVSYSEEEMAALRELEQYIHGMSPLHEGAQQGEERKPADVKGEYGYPQPSDMPNMNTNTHRVRIRSRRASIPRPALSS
jgi:hypothetical protein